MQYALSTHKHLFNEHFNLIFFLGDSAVGKTCFLNKYANNQFNPRFATTVGVDFQQKRVIRESRDSEGLLGPKQRLHLQLWDTAGQER
ncbi:unnamed protein product [Echinostoma caproni]|uniref:RAB27B, member RAS oncogene family n=1 Tax=Echinostoma caproni TaxID=27848 RepID=A0A183AV12_9TREM|nr:unnamed protein product [Echinostoma caproni]